MRLRRLSCRQEIVSLSGSADSSTDCPTSTRKWRRALDALTREELTLELLRIWSTEPKTILFVTHSIPEAVMLADRLVVMSARPGQVSEVLQVDLPRPRSFDMESFDEFQRCTLRVRQLIFGDCRLQAA